jgi:hypothetical protein
MVSQSAARTQDEANDAGARADDAPEGSGPAAYVVAALAIGAAFLAGATLIYRGLFVALMHVR